MYINNISQKAASFIQHKRFHPGNYKEMEKVWIAEEKAAAAERKEKELQSQKLQEKRLEELRRQHGHVTSNPALQWVTANQEYARVFMDKQANAQETVPEEKKEEPEYVFHEQNRYGRVDEAEVERRLREDPLMLIKKAEAQQEKRAELHDMNRLKKQIESRKGQEEVKKSEDEEMKDARNSTIPRRDASSKKKSANFDCDPRSCSPEDKRGRRLEKEVSGDTLSGKRKLLQRENFVTESDHKSGKTRMRANGTDEDEKSCNKNEINLQNRDWYYQDEEDEHFHGRSRWMDKYGSNRWRKAANVSYGDVVSRRSKKGRRMSRDSEESRSDERWRPTRCHGEARRDYYQYNNSRNSEGDGEHMRSYYRRQIARRYTRGSKRERSQERRESIGLTEEKESYTRANDIADSSAENLNARLKEMQVAGSALQEKRLAQFGEAEVVNEECYEEKPKFIRDLAAKSLELYDRDEALRSRKLDKQLVEDAAFYD